MSCFFSCCDVISRVLPVLVLNVSVCCVCVCLVQFRLRIHPAAFHIIPLPDRFRSQRQYNRHPRFGDDQRSEPKWQSNGSRTATTTTHASPVECTFPSISSASCPFPYAAFLAQCLTFRPVIVRWLVHVGRFEEAEVPVPHCWPGRIQKTESNSKFLHLPRFRNAVPVCNHRPRRW